MVGGAVVGVGGCTSPRYRTRYRFDLEVDTPAGVKKGSSVFEHVSYLSQGPRGVYLSDVRGEATLVDLPGGAVLVAVLEGAMRLPDGSIWPRRSAWYAHSVFARHFRVSPEWVGDKSPILERLSGMKESAPLEVLPDELPLLVRVRVPRSSRTIVAVDPDALSAEYGAGFAFRRATVQLTKDPFSWTIDERLPWVNIHTRPSTPWRLLPEGAAGPEAAKYSHPIEWFKAE